MPCNVRSGRDLVLVAQTLDSDLLTSPSSVLSPIWPPCRVWSVNKFKLEAVPSDLVGTFYGGDSYLVLHSYKKVGASDGALLHDIHFWQGSQSTQVRLPG